MELVYTQHLKCCLARDVGSIPALGTGKKKICRKSKNLLNFSSIKRNAPIAQLVERLPLKETVVGSNPTGCTRYAKKDHSWASGEMAYTLALGASAARRGGSSPPSPTDKTYRYFGGFVLNDLCVTKSPLVNIIFTLQK